MDQDPIARFHELQADAVAKGEGWDGTRCVLATADAQGRPSARFVLVKQVDAQGFTFYTNLGSRKAKELAVNPWATLCFHWGAIGVQVRAEGGVTQITDEEADAYFASRPRESRLGAWASKQSAPISSREALLDELESVRRRFEDREVPRPPFWSGFRLSPERIELWFEGEFRLHDRFLYERRTGPWEVTRLQP